MKKLKTIVISDIHITSVFNQHRYDYLYDLISRCERVIVNGDFWSYYSITFDDFLKSKWQGLFPLMKDKGCIYIYGNHDRKEWCDSRADRFSILQANDLIFNENGNNLLITHGHLISSDSITNEMYIGANRKVNDFNKFNQSYRFYIFLQKSLLNIMGEERYPQIPKKLNRPHYKYIIDKMPKDQILVAGHTHAPEFDLEKRYVNVGFINFGIGFYLHINGEELSLDMERFDF